MELELPEAIVVSNNTYNVNALGAVRSLGIQGIKVTWISPDCSRWFYSKYSTPMICPDFRQEEERFLDFLIKLSKAKKSRRSVVIPTSDAAVIVLSKNKAILDEYVIPLVCDWRTTKKFINKDKSYEIAKSVGIKVPLTFYPQNETDLISIASDLNYPCLIKPTQSHAFGQMFKMKLFRVDNFSELVTNYRFFVSKGFEKMMIQEEITGEDKHLVTLNTVLNLDSEPLALFMHRRLFQNPPRFGVVSLGESIWEPKIIEPALKLLKAMNFNGIAQVEFKYDPTSGEFNFIEINGRSYLSISLPTACRLNLLYLAYKNAIGDAPSALTDYSCEYDCGVKWLDFPSYVESIVKLRKVKKEPLTKYIIPLLHSKLTFGTFSRSDLVPFLMELDYLLSNIKNVVRTISDKSVVYKGLV